MKKYISCIVLFICAVSNIFAEQKVALITGASGGIGIATVKAFVEQGWKVWAAYRKEKPHELADLNNVHFVQFDLTKDIQIKTAIELLIQEEGRIDALVNNAGIGIIGAEETITIEDARYVFEVNVFGPLQLIQHVAPIMRKQNSGHIINITSTSGLRALPGLGMYAATKFALEGLSESLAVTLSPWNIQVTIIEPGAVKTRWVENCMQGNRICDEHQIYHLFAERLTAKQTAAAENGQSSEEVAQLILQVAEMEKPNMRYQTSDKVKQLVAKKLVDITGNQMRDEQFNFFYSLLAP